MIKTEKITYNSSQWLRWLDLLFCLIQFLTRRPWLSSISLFSFPSIVSFASFNTLKIRMTIIYTYIFEKSLKKRKSNSYVNMFNLTTGGCGVCNLVILCYRLKHYESDSLRYSVGRQHQTQFQEVENKLTFIPGSPGSPGIPFGPGGPLK